MLVRGAVVAVGERRALTGLALPGRRVAVRDPSLERAASHLLLDEVDRGADAVTVLNTARVLPSEGARESHQLYVQAHVLAALDEIRADRLDAAGSHVTQAFEWPEHLGQGRPYVPEERLLLFLRAELARRQQRAGAERDALAQIAAATTPGGALAITDVLAIPALQTLSRRGDVPRVLAAADRPGTDPGVAALAHALDAGTLPSDLRARFPRLFADTDAELILRALELARR